MMRLNRISMFAAAITVGVISSHAAAVNWQHTYDASVAPDDASATPQWTASQSDGSATVSGGTLTIDTADDDRRTYQLTDSDPAWDASDKLTLEFRMRVNDQYNFGDGNWDRAAALNVHTGSVRFDLQIFGDADSPGWAQLVRSSTGSFQMHELSTGEFHTYRVVIDQAEDTYQLYVDDDPNPVFDRNASELWTTSTNAVSFGDTSDGDMGGISEWDYIRWTNDEATPVPEPASLGLMLLGGSLMAMRRRR